jgi:hypothetical protein
MGGVCSVKECSWEQKEVLNMTFQRTMQDIPVGTPVLTRDGEEFGTVKEARGAEFKVNAQGQPDYWLPTSCLSSATTGRLRVDAPKDRIGDLKVDEPKAR